MKFLFLAILCFGLSAQAFDKPQILSDLKNLYPYLSADQIQQKIAAANNADKFLRSFSAYYFYSLRRDPSLVGNMIKLGREGGWCVGDAHYSNFGAVLDRRGQSHFTFNDMDDSGPCPLISDYLKFLTSVRLKTPDQDLLTLVRNYKYILQGAPWGFSSTVKDLLAQSAKQGLQINPSLLQSPKNLKRDDGAREVTDTEKTEIVTALNRSYGQGQILDLFATAKESGGSFGLLRFRVLFQDQNGTHLIQFKQQVDPAISPLAVAPVPATAERIITTLNMEQGDGYSIYYNVQKVNGMTMLLEPVYWGNISVDPSEYSGQSLNAIAGDEAKVLGLIHKKTASDNYIHLAVNTPDGDWVAAAQNLAWYFKSVYQTIKN